MVNVDSGTLRLLMATAGMSQKELVKRSGVCRTSVSHAMNGRASFETLMKLSKPLDVDPRILVDKDQ